jgi:hypothetical protein
VFHLTRVFTGRALESKKSRSELESTLGTSTETAETTGVCARHVTAGTQHSKKSLRIVMIRFLIIIKRGLCIIVIVSSP